MLLSDLIFYFFLSAGGQRNTLKRTYHSSFRQGVIFLHRGDTSTYLEHLRNMSEGCVCLTRNLILFSSLSELRFQFPDPLSQGEVHPQSSFPTPFLFLFVLLLISTCSDLTNPSDLAFCTQPHHRRSNIFTIKLAKQV